MNAEKHPLYRPIKAKKNSKIFDACVVALSTIHSSERVVLTDILRRFGAVLVTFTLAISNSHEQVFFRKSSFVCGNSEY